MYGNSADICIRGDQMVSSVGRQGSVLVVARIRFGSRRQHSQMVDVEIGFRGRRDSFSWSRGGVGIGLVPHSEQVPSEPFSRRDSNP